MQRGNSTFVLPYQRPDDLRHEVKEHFWVRFADLLAYSVVWGVVGTLAAALLGSVVLWGVLVASTSQ